MRMSSLILVGSGLLAASSENALSGDASTLRVEARDDAGAPLTVRLHLMDTHGAVVQPPDVFFQGNYCVIAETADLKVPGGPYRYEAEHGPEHAMAEGLVEVPARGVATLRLVAPRIANLAAEHWWSGDLHTHRDPADMPLLVQAEDLHVAPVITWWNAKSYWNGHPRPDTPLSSLPGSRFVHVMAGEDERGGGALLYFNLGEPLAITGAATQYPSSVVFAQAARERGAHIDIEKPFWWDVPAWLALGLANTIGIANNHMCRDSMYEDEAWGKPRDAVRLPPPRGNGYWTQEIYYHILNAGLRIPPSAGSAAGVLPNPVGYNRVYVHVDGELTYDAWWESLRAGRSFVTNGPMLRVTANGELPGHVFSGGEAITLAMHLTARDLVPALEVIYNGTVVATIPVAERDQHLSAIFPVDRDGWFLVRAIADVPHTFRFASTAAFYIQRDGAPPHISRASCQFFLDWVRERMTKLDLADPAQREEVMRFYRQAEDFWSRRRDAATAD